MIRSWIPRWARDRQLSLASRRCPLHLTPFEDRTLPATFVVLNANDAGFGSLRQAVIDSNGTAGGANQIVFEATFFGSTARTINLTSGELFVNQPVAMLGSGMKLLTVSGTNSSRMINIDSTATGQFTLNDMTLTGGKATGNGGAVQVRRESVMLSRVTLIGNRAAGFGGAVFHEQGKDSMLRFNDCVISGNTVGTAGVSDGGGIAIGSPTAGHTSDLVITNSSVSDNLAPDQGGGVAIGSNVGVFIQNSAVIRNQAGYASKTGGGAGIVFTGTVGANGFVIRNSTVAANTVESIDTLVPALGGGGVALVNLVGTAHILNSTITDNFNAGINSGPGQGGGGIAVTGSNSILNIRSSIVSGNESLAGKPDISAVNPVNFDHSAIGSSLGFLIGATNKNLPFGKDLMLTPMTNFGGPTEIYAIRPGSPLIDAGTNTSLTIPPINQLTTDQRGTGYDRLVGGDVDIGSFERVGGVALIYPVSSTPVDITATNASDSNPFRFTLTYENDEPFVLSSINGDEVQVTGPGGFSAFAKFTGFLPGATSTFAVAQYSLTPPGGGWDFLDNGVFLFEYRAGSINSPGGFTAMSTMMAMSCVMPVNYIVTTTADSGAGSLRDAINSANTNGAGTIDIISFSPLFDAPQSLNLSSSMSITDGVIITGPGADKLTITAPVGNRILTIDNSDATQIATTISGMTLQNGNVTGNGGAIEFANENLLLVEMHIKNNTATGHGGGIAASSGGATLSVTRSTFSGNKATTVGTSLGGGAFMNGATYYAGNATILNSTIAGNSAAKSGGGFAGSYAIPGVGITTTLDQSTVTGNTAGTSGGGISLGDTNALDAIAINANSTIVSGNTGPTGPDIADALVFSSYSAFGTSTGHTLGGSSFDLPFGSSLALGLLTANGGPTPTVSIGNTSAAIDAGPGGSSELTDQRTAGYSRVVGTAMDIGAFERQPSLTSIVVNHGDAQRSRVLSIEAFFSTNVSAGNYGGLGAVKLQRTAVASIGTGAVGDIIRSAETDFSRGTILVTQGASNSLVLTFDNTTDNFFNPVSETKYVEHTSLADGYWQLIVGPNTTLAGLLDLRRLYGDSTTSLGGTVDGADLTDFGNFFGTSTIKYDFNNDGTIDGADLTVFGNRFGNVL
jgi:fibronectin-binding autotransporter adhesin